MATGHGGREISMGLATPGADVVGVNDAKRTQLVSRAFRFPYPAAYPIQLDLMQAVFRAIEDRQIGLFESPTGTVRCRGSQRHPYHSLIDFLTSLGQISELDLCCMYLVATERGTARKRGGREDERGGERRA